MTTTTTQKISFDQFLEQCPQGLYELINGEIVEARATRNHDDVADLLLFSFNDEIRRGNIWEIRKFLLYLFLS